MKSNLIKIFKNFIFQEKIFSREDKLVVGISGGADSVCLVELLLLIQEKFNLELYLVHINYHLRGKESDKDEKFVIEFAEKKGLGLSIINYEKQDSESSNLEEAFRDFRYSIFEKIREGRQFDWVVVAHHQDDQVETFLINLFRGAGINGLKGMKIINDERKILRPLLGFSKKDIKDFLQSIKQEYREDKSNQDNTFLRNKIRNELIPEIEKDYSSKFKDRISNATKQLRGYLNIVEQLIDEAYVEVTEGVDGRQIKIDVERYGKLKKEIKPLVFRKIVKTLKGDLNNVTQNNYLEFEKIVRSKKGKQQVMQLRGLKFERKKENIVVKGPFN